MGNGKAYKQERQKSKKHIGFFFFIVSPAFRGKGSFPSGSRLMQLAKRKYITQAGNKMF